MITETNRFQHDPHRCQWVVRPNRSMTWREAQWFVGGVAAISLTIGLYFLWRGFPLVLPFSGLEALAVAVAFYIVLESGENREIITLSESLMVIEKGKRQPETRAEFQRAWARIELRPSLNRWYPGRLVVASHGREVEIGRFLTDGERQHLAKTLINAMAKNR